ncbi:MAG: DNA-formamidopyrimidine glycosylase family protein [Pirellulaceae bacterium]
MPEGHKTHYIARRHTQVLSGQALKVNSPQGRFRGDARKVSGVVLDNVSAVGKHLFYKFDNGRLIHIHLGRYGKFRQHTNPPPAPIGKVRVRMVSDQTTIDLNGPTTCRVIDEITQAEVVAKLGPDPLAGGRKTVAWEKIRVSKKPIGALLLDQSVIAGIGNIFRAEILNDAALSPWVRGCQMERTDFDRMWRSTSRLMKLGLKHGKIITITAKEAGKPLSQIEGRDRFRVYGQPHCRICDYPVEVIQMASRNLYWCPHCQAT